MAEDQIIKDILGLLNSRSESISSLDLAKHLNADHQRVVGAIKSIFAQTSTISDNFLNVEQREFRKLDLTNEGEIILKNGSHEARVFQTVQSSMPNGIDQVSLMKSIPDASMAKVGFSKAMSNGWIKMDKESKKIKPSVDKIEDSIQDLIRSIHSMSMSEGAAGDAEGIETKILADLKKRKLVTESVIKFYLVSKGKDFQTTIEPPERELTTALLQSGEWKTKTFKGYNFNSLGVIAERGHVHPLLKVKEQVKQIFLEMGFTEMPTNNFVESSFWNFDTLVVPQAHPARDSQDTFFVSQPELCHPIEDDELVERVRFAHHGSEEGCWPKGYQYKWSERESFRNVLRTHTTAVTSRMLYKLAEEHKHGERGSFKPAKFFSIDRVFRNETLDQTHLAEFHQVEGVVVDEDLTLGDLMGVLQAFFEKLGMKKLRFKPAYNPYTEPSMEIFAFHPKLNRGEGKWIEIGNSGVFRPEMLTALGLPESVTAIAWGLSLERPTMIKYNIDNIRDLFGHKVDIRKVQESPLYFGRLH